MPYLTYLSCSRNAEAGERSCCLDQGGPTECGHLLLHNFYISEQSFAFRRKDAYRTYSASVMMSLGAGTWVPAGWHQQGRLDLEPENMLETILIRVQFPISILPVVFLSK